MVPASRRRNEPAGNAKVSVAEGVRGLDGYGCERHRLAVGEAPAPPLCQAEAGHDLHAPVLGGPASLEDGSQLRQRDIEPPTEHGPRRVDG